MNRIAAVLILFPTVFFAPPASGQTPPPGYYVIHVTDDGGYHPWPRINAKGQVVFSRWNSDRNTDEIFMYDVTTRTLTQVTNDNVCDVMPDINDAGTIVWARAIGPTDPHDDEAPFEIMMLKDGVTTRLTNNATADYAPRINNNDQVVWQHSTGVYACGGDPMRDIWTWNAEGIAPITTDANVNLVDNQSPVINDLGQIAWTRYNFCNAPHGWNFTSDIKLCSDGQIIRVTTDDQPQGQVPSINNRCQVLYNYSDHVALKDAIAVWQSGVTTVICNDDCGLATINDHGDVASYHEANRVSDIWLFKGGQIVPLTNDAFRDIQPQISPRGDVVWSSGISPSEDIRVAVRMPLGDLNCDGSTNQFDIQGFVEALSNRALYEQNHPNCDPFLADTNQDGSINQFDIQGFADILTH